jgi:hypothetical protein
VSTSGEVSPKLSADIASEIKQGVGGELSAGVRRVDLSH